MSGEDVDEPRRDRDGTSGCAGLGLSVGEVPGDFGEVPFDADCPFERLVVLDSEPASSPNRAPRRLAR